MSVNQTQEKAYEMIKKRNAYYYNSFRFLVVIFLLSIVAFISLLLAVVNISFGQKQAWYIPINLNGKVIIREDITTKNTDGYEITDEYIANWVQRSLPFVYNFNFLSSTVNFRNMIGFFTLDGYKAYRYSLETQSKTISTIKAANYVVQGYGCGKNTVNIISQGIQNVQGYPVYTWRLQMPMVAKYVSSTDSLVMKADLIIDLQRVSKLISFDGIAIYSFIVTNQVFYTGGNTDLTVDQLCTNLFKT